MTNTSPGGNAYVPGGAIGSTVSAESFGASPSASSSANVASINAALARGGLVTLNTPGTYTIGKSSTALHGSLAYDVCLVIPSNTTFRIGPNVILQTAAGLNNPALIQNSNLAGGNVNIALEGGIYDGNSPNVTRTDGATDFACIHMWFQNIVGLSLEKVTCVNPRAWGIGVGAVVNGTFVKTRFIYTCAVTSNQGGFQVQGGPSSNLVFRDTFGNTYDDLVAFDTDDVTIYPTAMAGPGPISDVLVDGVMSDETGGCLHFIRLLDSTANPITRCIIRNLSGPYLQGAVFIAPAAGKTPAIINVTIDGVKCNPLTGQNPPVGTFHIYSGFDSITITNVDRAYVDASESTKRPVFEIGSGGTAANLKISNVHIADQTTAGANVNLISNASLLGVLEISNVTVTVTQANGSNVLLGSASGGTFGRVLINNIQTIRVKSLFSTAVSVGQGLWASNVYMLNNHAAAFIQNVAAAFPVLALSNVNLDGTQGGASGCINVTGVTGTMRIQMQNCIFSNGANVNLVRSAAEAIRVQSDDTPVPSGILTPARGDIILDSSNNNDPYRYSGSAWEPFSAGGAYTYNAPTTGFSLTIANGIGRLVLDPAGTLATGTVTMPATPADGEEVGISSTQIITALTISGNSGQTMADTISTLGVGGCVTFKWVAAQTKWYRVGN
jgi:hypothetical protein